MKMPLPERYVPGDVTATFRNCRGYYERPLTAKGKRIGPLVGYAGSYKTDDPSAPMFKHFVGHAYYNAAKVEVYPEVFERLAADWKAEWYKNRGWGIAEPTIFLAAPMGGILFAHALASMFDGAKVIYAEKRIIKPGFGSERDETDLVLERHVDELQSNDQVVIVDDICNNLTNAKSLMGLVTVHNCTTLAIACIVNRSTQTELSAAVSSSAALPDSFSATIPIVPVAHIPTVQFRQDDPAVAVDIKMGYVVWKPKAENSWRILMEVMDQFQPGGGD